MAWLIKEDKFDSPRGHFFSAAGDVDHSLGYLAHLMLWAEGLEVQAFQFPNAGRIVGPDERRRVRETLDEGCKRERGLPWQARYVRPKEETPDDHKILQKSTWALVFREFETSGRDAARTPGVERSMVRHALEHVRSIAAAETPPRRLLAAAELGKLLTDGKPTKE